MKRTIPQNKRLHFLLAKLGIDKYTCSDMVFNFTGGRTTSSAELTINECNTLIKKLEAALYKDIKKQNRQIADLRQKARRTVFKLMYDCGFLDSSMNNTEKVNIINAFIKQRTRFKGILDSLSYEELGAVINQLQAIRHTYNEQLEKQAIYN